MANNTFPRTSRLLTSGDYDKVFKKPVRVSAPGILLLATDNQEAHARLGLVVPKKVLKRAVWRNRVKRIVRESFRNSQALLPHADLVFIARQGIKELENEQLASSLAKLWDQISRRLKSQQS